jgi:hypothetical protein
MIHAEPGDERRPADQRRKRVCLKNLHVINGPSPQQTMATIKFHNARDRDKLIDIVIWPVEFSEGAIGLLQIPRAGCQAIRGARPGEACRCGFRITSHRLVNFASYRNQNVRH